MGIVGWVGGFDRDVDWSVGGGGRWRCPRGSGMGGGGRVGPLKRGGG